MVPTHKHRWGVGTRKGEGELGRLTRLARRVDLRYLSNTILHPGVERRQGVGKSHPSAFATLPPIALMWFDAPLFSIWNDTVHGMDDQNWFGFAMVSVGLLLGTVTLIWLVW